MLKRKEVWPLLNKWKEEGLVWQLDLEMAKEIVSLDQEKVFAAAVIAYLGAATRLGHLGVRINGDPRSIWEEAYGRVPDQIDTIIEKGFSLLPPHPLLVKTEKMLYFKRYYEAEQKIQHHLDRLLSAEPAPLITISSYPPSLFPEQQEAIEKASTQSLTIICGGPGTGKTYTAGLLIEKLTEQKKLRVAAAAPTGKAAAALGKSLKMPATTLHQLLRSSPIFADIILIDESSMIDVEMMAALFAAIPTGSRLILLGDSHQLPPVEAGSLFTDLISYVAAKGRPAAQLKTCQRVELRSILTLAEAVYEGEEIKALEQAPLQPLSMEDISHFAEQSMPLLKEEPVDPHLLQKTLTQAVILSPLRKGPYGVEALNQFLYRQEGATPIIITKNTPSQELFNGDTGLLWKGKGYFLDRSSFLVRVIPAPLLPPHELAYCLSIHKSQGSEYNEVLVLLPPGTERFGREVLYTGITRAKKKLHLMGDSSLFQQLIRKKTIRYSGLG